jgi:hypothetical protein
MDMKKAFLGELKRMFARRNSSESYLLICLVETALLGKQPRTYSRLMAVYGADPAVVAKIAKEYGFTIPS